MIHKTPGKKVHSDFTFQSTFETYQILASGASDDQKWKQLAYEVASIQNDKLLMDELDISSTDIARAKIEWQNIQKQHQVEEDEYFG